MACLCACSTSEIDPDKLPYRLELERRLSYNTRAIDLDGDGRDEFYYNFTYAPGKSANESIEALLLNSQTSGVIDQVNFMGHIEPPLFRDVDGDERLEALVPVTRNDSLFLTIVNADGRKLSSLFLIDGRPRVEPDGIIPWSANFLDAAAHDLDGDGSRELITVVSAGLARMPRGVLVHRLSDGTRLGQAIVGATIHKSIISDFDGDGRPEVFVSTTATNNGAVAGGFSDAHAYLMLFETWPVPRVRWHREVAGTATIIDIARPDYDGDGRAEILVMAAQTNPGFLEILDTRTWRTLRTRQIGQAIGPSVAIDIDRDGRLEIVAPSPPHEILLFDDDLEIMVRARTPMIVGAAASLPDLDGDGIREIAIGTHFSTITSGGFLLFGPRLDLKAAFSEGWPVGVLHAGGSVPPSIIVDRQGQLPLLLKLAPNRLFLLQRYGPGAASFATIVTLILAGVAFQRHRRRSRQLLTLRGAALEHSTEGLLLIDRRGRVAWMNTTLARWCGRVPDPRGSTPFSSISQLPPALSKFCRECLACDPPRQLTTSEPFGVGAEEPLVTAIGEPALAGLRTDPHWLIRVQNAAATSAELTAAWAPLARRTAHDLRNPLTSILLTIQRLQIEYRTAAPDLAPTLDAYATRLQQRVDQLRRLASNFLKLLGAEKAHLEEHDLNTIARESVDTIRAGLPPDLRLELRLAENLPPVVVDREQIESVLENLVANAINAMPEGGTITVSTHLARGLRLAAAHNSDCVQLEVLDTGIGIDPAVVPRIFEPGFSTNNHGSGLGLAIVKKIVDDHGGEVSVESEVGTGTAFTILLPVAAPHYAEV